MICPTCHLPVSFHDDATHCTVPATPARRAVIAAQAYRITVEMMPIDYRAKSEMLAQVDEQIDFLKGAYA